MKSASLTREARCLVGPIKQKAPIRGLNFIPTSRDTLLLAQSIRLQLSAQ